jgi:hypothetical protein
VTTFQDQPPQSRRAAREARLAAETAPFEMAVDDADRPAPAGRRARHDEPDAQAPDAVADTSPTPQVPEPSGSAPRFRVRDFSPEGRSTPPNPFAGLTVPAAPPAPPISSLPVPPAPTPPPSAPPMTRRELRMREQAEAAARAQALVEPESPQTSPFAVSEAITNIEALTRAGSVDAPPSAQPDAAWGPAAAAGDATPEPVTADQSAAEDKPAASQPVPDEPPAAQAQPAPVLEFSDAETSVAEPATASDDSAPGSQPAAPSQPTGSFTELLSAFPSVDPEPSSAHAFDWNAGASAPAADEYEEVAAPAAEDPLVPEFVEPQVVRESYTPPVGHWSRQTEVDPDLAALENTLTREVGGGSSATTTTSALILPTIPQADFNSVINGTGEILVTGTISLPHGFGSTGADTRHLDNPDVDHLFDAFDGEVVSSDSQPVRAIRAVSTHTSSQAVIQVQKPKGNRSLTVLLFTTCGLAVVAVGFLVVAVLTNTF